MNDDVERVARAIYDDQHRNMKNCWAWDDIGLDDEHPGARQRYIRWAAAAMRETRLIDAEALREDACCIGYGNDDVIRGAKLGADWLKGRAT